MALLPTLLTLGVGYNLSTSKGYSNFEKPHDRLKGVPGNRHVGIDFQQHLTEYRPYVDPAYVTSSKTSWKKMRARTMTFHSNRDVRQRGIDNVIMLNYRRGSGYIPLSSTQLRTPYQDRRV